MTNACSLQKSFFTTQKYIDSFKALPSERKAAVITAIVLPIITLLTVAVLGHLSIITGLNSTAIFGMGIGAGAPMFLFLISLAIYYSLKSCYGSKSNNFFLNGQQANPKDPKENPNLGNPIPSNTKVVKVQTTHSINRSAAEYLFDFLEDPRKHLEQTQTDNGVVVRFSELTECCCCSSEFDRFKNDRRKNIEDKMLTNATTQFPPDSTDCIRYLGFGAGGLLQDFINVGKLLRAGYKKVEVTLVDPKFFKPEAQKRFEFLKLAAEALSIQLNISYSTKADELEGNFHIISAIDFDTFTTSGFNPAIAIQRQIINGGRYYLSFNKYDLIFDHHELVETRYHDRFSIHTNRLVNSFKSLSFENKQLHVTFIENSTNIFQWIYCLPTLIKDKGIEKVFITLPVSEKIGYLDDSTLKPPADKSESLLQLFRLLLPNIAVEAQFFDSFEELNEQPKAQDVILWIEGIRSQTQIESQIRLLRQTHSEAVHFYWCGGYNEKNTNSIVWQGAWKWSEKSSTEFFMPTSKDRIMSLMSI